MIAYSMLREFLRKNIPRQRLEEFISARGNDSFTLDIGCANSRYAHHFPHRVGFDVREGKGVDVMGDAHELPFKDEEFEQVLCTEVLEHLHTPDRAIGEMYRVLKPGGRLLLTTRFIFPIHDAPGDYYRFTKYGLCHLFREWHIISLEEEVGTGETFGVLLQRLGYQTDPRGGVLTKAFFFLVAKTTSIIDFLLKTEYGMRNKVAVYEEKNILASGYYLEASKK